MNFDDDAERSVLGGVMIAPRYLPRVRGEVSSKDFFRPAHQRIFGTILAVADEGLEPDPFTVADRLRDDEDVEGLGGRGYVLTLPSVGVASWAPQNALIIRRLYEERCRRNDLATVLTDIGRFVGRYVFLALPEQLTAIVLWIAHTWIVEQFETTPYLSMQSPEKRSGKTRVLDVAEPLVREPWRMVTPSEAVLYRKIESDRPTLLLDEVDAIFGARSGANYEGVRAILNAGFRRGTKVPRCVGEGKNITIQDFDVYGAKAFAGIGSLPDTVADRSIVIEMLRRAPDEHIERFRYREAAAAAGPLWSALERWSTDVDLTDARPDIPTELDDRAADSWEALLAIADSAGGEWPEKARRAARVLSAGRMEETASSGIRLLVDCKRIFEAADDDRLTSEKLVHALIEIEESPWSDMTARKLAAQLKHYRITSTTIRIGDRTAKGYRVSDFADAWKRYLPTASPPETTIYPSHRNISEELAAKKAFTCDLESVTNGLAEVEKGVGVSDTDYGDLQGNMADVTDVTHVAPIGAEVEV